jgi:hypothetical protein
VAWGQPISSADTLSRPRDYYAAQGNATRLFFRKGNPGWPEGWAVFHRQAFASFSYLLAGGFTKPAVYPRAFLGALERIDHLLTRWPRLFGARCLVGLTPR